MLLHSITNIVSGLSFWLTAMYLNKFIARVMVRIESEHTHAHPVWLSIARHGGLINTLIMVFFFCGFGHILDGLGNWGNKQHLEVVHMFTAVAGTLLVLRLTYLFYGIPNKRN